MSFLFPLGLLGLIAIPILIIIYILRNRYQEHTVSSSYLFELSNRFLKKKKKKKRFESLLSLILEIVAVLILSISLAHPIFYKSDNAENLCFIIDASGSMNILNENTSRFDLAKEKMDEIVKQANQGSTYTIIYAGLETKTIVKKTDNKDIFFQFSKQLAPEYAYIELDSALEKAEEYYQNGEISKLILLTDKNYEEVENIELINVSSHEENYATYDLKVKESKDSFVFSGKLISFESNVSLKINLYLDEELIDTQEVDVVQNVEGDYKFEIEKVDYQEAAVEIENVDALSLDNYNFIYNITEENESSILLVSESPFYLNAMINAIGDYAIKTVKPEEYQPESDYDLYIFDCYTPKELPSSGSVWLLNTEKNIDHTGFLVQDERIVTPENVITYNNENTPLYEQMTKDVKYNPIMLYKYKKYSLYRNFTTVFSYDSIPLLFVGMTETNLREVVFAFDLHDSDLPLLYDFAPIMRNLLNYSLPHPVEDKNYVVGDSMQINVSNDIESVKITTPSNKVSFINLNSSIEYYTLSEVGTYNVVVTENGRERNYRVYVAFDIEEGQVTVNEESISLSKNENIKKNTAVFDHLFIIILLGAVVFAIDWVVYSRGQY
ncbi:MAG: VWA domain-containing protein [Erysipelotrichales bacterium]|nr:VWA domain-containing protein [Erysipelotrichales bacterium]